MPLCYTMLSCALQGAVPQLSFLAKPHQPNGYNNQMVLVDLLEGDKSDTPTTHGCSQHRLNYGPAHDYDHNHDYGPDIHNLSSHDPDLRPQNFMHVGYSSTTYQSGQACYNNRIQQLIALGYNQADLIYGYVT